MKWTVLYNEVQMANKHMDKRSIFLVIRELELKTTPV